MFSWLTRTSSCYPGAYQHLSQREALAFPKPPHRVARPCFASAFSFFMILSRVTIIFAPDSPRGCPRWMAHPTHTKYTD